MNYRFPVFFNKLIELNEVKKKRKEKEINIDKNGNIFNFILIWIIFYKNIIITNPFFLHLYFVAALWFVFFFFFNSDERNQLS